MDVSNLTTEILSILEFRRDFQKELQFRPEHIYPYLWPCEVDVLYAGVQSIAHHHFEHFQIMIGGTPGAGTKLAGGK